MSQLPPSSAQPLTQPEASPTKAAAKPQTPLPRWIEYCFLVVLPFLLLMPDGLFNYYVYSDGAWAPTGSPLLAGLQITLWGGLALGVVAISYFLAVLAPYHWSRGRWFQGVCCFLGMFFATGITIWNSFAYRSSHFIAFKVDSWAAQIIHLPPGASITMILVAIAPPCWVLFWALIQPGGARDTAEMQVSHQEKLLRAQQHAELARVKAEANAQVRTAQVAGLGAVAKAARAQAVEVLQRDKAVEAVPSAIAETTTHTQPRGQSLALAQPPHYGTRPVRTPHDDDDGRASFPDEYLGTRPDLAIVPALEPHTRAARSANRIRIPENERETMVERMTRDGPNAGAYEIPDETGLTAEEQDDPRVLGATAIVHQPRSKKTGDRGSRLARNQQQMVSVGGRR